MSDSEDLKQKALEVVRDLEGNPDQFLRDFWPSDLDEQSQVVADLQERYQTFLFRSPPGDDPGDDLVVTRSDKQRGVRKSAAEFRKEAQVTVSVIRRVVRQLPPDWRPIVNAYIREAERRERLPTYKRTAAATGTSARKVSRIISRALKIASKKERGALNLRKELRPSEFKAYHAEELRNLRNGIDTGTGRPLIEVGSPGPLQGFANLYRIDTPFIDALCDVFADLVQGVDSPLVLRVKKVIQPLLGRGHRDRLETIWAALVLEHLREENEGQLPFSTHWLATHPVDVKNGRPVRCMRDGPAYDRIRNYSTVTDSDRRTWYKRARTSPIELVADLCWQVFPECRLRVNLRLRENEVTFYPAMGRRLQQRIVRLERTERLRKTVQTTYQKICLTLQ